MKKTEWRRALIKWPEYNWGLYWECCLGKIKHRCWLSHVATCLGAWRQQADRHSDDGRRLSKNKMEKKGKKKTQQQWNMSPEWIREGEVRAKDCATSPCTSGECISFAAFLPWLTLTDALCPPCERRLRKQAPCTFSLSAFVSIPQLI